MDILQPLRYVDETIHRPYEKIGAKLDKLGAKKRYQIATLLNIAGAPATIIAPPPSLIFTVYDGYANFHACRNGLSQDNLSETKTKDPYLVDIVLGFNRFVRTPFFTVGATFAGAAVYDIAASLYNREPVHPKSALLLMEGIGIIYVASSMFLKDKNPKLLERSSLWSQISSWVKDKVSSPIPEVATTCARLEDLV